MLENTINLLFGSQLERELKKLLPILHRINEKESWAMGLKQDQFPAQTGILQKRLKEGEKLDKLIPEAFALVREAARRTLGERLYDVQLLAGIVLHHGKIMEMKTGEGKTLSSVSAAYLNALTGQGVHIVTVNDYLAERDALWMGPIYSYLGITVGSILANMDNDARKKAYSQDITYGTNNEFGFDYLRDNMAYRKEDMVQRGHNYCVIDEIDSILIDEARTPLIISGPAQDDTQKFGTTNRLIAQLTECEKDPDSDKYPEEPVGDYKLEEKGKRITFTDQGMNHIEAILLQNKMIQSSLFNEENFEYIHYFTQALKAHKLFHIDVDYVIEDGQVQIVDEFTGRILHGRRYSEGLHQAIEAKEGIKVARRNRTLATITFQNYFRMYKKISGMTGTADTEAREFSRIYDLDVAVIPTNRPIIREDVDDVIYLNEGFKLEAICDEIAKHQKKGQPVLVGTVSIEKSELLAKALTRRGVRHEVLNAKNHAREATIIAEAGAKAAVTIATNMAGRGTDIKLGGNPDFRARRRAGTEASQEDYNSAYALELEKWRKDYEEVKSLGGLYVLGTERHESRRIDNQLRGRSGRQGDPGKSRFFISLDDNLMRLFGGQNLKGMMAKLGMRDKDPIFHPWINKSIERAQKRVEEYNYDIRKNLLEYDDVLNVQRNFIYQQRALILEDHALTKRVLDTIGEMAGQIIETIKDNESDEGIARNSLITQLHEQFLIQITPETLPENLLNSDNHAVQDAIMESIEKDLTRKSTETPPGLFNDFIRFEYLRSIDQRWQDHLENLEALRDAVMLRHYAQKNPLSEYKREGFEIFDKLITEIRTNIARKISRVQIEKQAGPQRRPLRMAEAQASHANLNQFAGAGQPREQAPRERVQVQRVQPKVGRNDPCPCGSGKKYKHCCGR